MGELAKVIDRKSNAQVIIEWFEGRLNDKELTPTNWEYFDRIKCCYRSQMNFQAKGKTLKMLEKTFNVSRATAQRIYNETEQIYGSTHKFDKNFKRHQAEEMAKAAYRKAKILESPKLMVAAANAFIRASGVELENADIPGFQDLDPGDVITLLPAAISDAILRKLEMGVVDLNQADYTIEIEHEEITQGDDRGDQSTH
jgi:hypothetical protein